MYGNEVIEKNPYILSIVSNTLKITLKKSAIPIQCFFKNILLEFGRKRGIHFKNNLIFQK